MNNWLRTLFEKLKSFSINIFRKFDFKTIIAFIALVLSIVNSYFQFFHEDMEISINANINTTPIAGHDYNIEFIIFNTGNQNVVVKNIEPIIIEDDKSVWHKFLIPWKFADESILLKPGDIKIVTRTINFHNFKPSDKYSYHDHMMSITGEEIKVNAKGKKGKGSDLLIDI